MKKNHFFYIISLLAVIALIAGVISYATEIRPPQVTGQEEKIEKAREKITHEPTTVTGKKKACGCCAERMARARELILKARQRRQASANAEPPGVLGK